VSLSGRTKVAVDTKMKPKGTTFEPDSAALREVGGLGLLDKSKNARIELTRKRLLAGWHRQLHMVESNNFRHDYFPELAR